MFSLYRNLEIFIVYQVVKNTGRTTHPRDRCTILKTLFSVTLRHSIRVHAREEIIYQTSSTGRNIN